MPDVAEIFIWMGVDHAGEEFPLIEPNGTRPMIERTALAAASKYREAREAGRQAGMRYVRCVSFRRETMVVMKELR